jgi:hypothetical protein
MKKTIFFILFFATLGLQAQSFKLAVAKYRGGGDWYSNPSSITNLISFCNDQLGTDIDPEYDIVEVGSPELYNYPFVHMTGHGNVVFDAQEAENIRKYLIAGGFLHIDDNYGMDPYIRPELKKVFPELELVELPFDHPIYHSRFEFDNGLPKVHEHDDLPPQGFGLIYEGRLVAFYSYESDLGDGWEDAEVHNDSPQIREQSLQMGANLIQFVFLGEENP